MVRGATDLFGSKCNEHREFRDSSGARCCLADGPGQISRAQDHKRDDPSIMMFEEVAPTNTVTDLRVHHDSDEIAYVLGGEVTFKIGDQVTVGGSGHAHSCREACRTREEHRKIRGSD